MKQTLFLVLFVLCFAGAAMAQGQAQGQGNVFQCVRPDGTVVCTVQDTSGNPSVTCNHDCADCNLVCAAKLRLESQGGGAMTPVTPPAVQGRPRQTSAPGTVETPAYCAQRYQECVSQCRSNPINRGSDALTACLGSCESWKSGCGRWHPSRDAR